MKVSHIDKSRVINTLLNHLGKDKAITCKQLAKVADMTESANVNQTRTRATIRMLIRESKIAIGFCQQGYYIIQTEEEFKECLEAIDEKLIGLEKRRQALINSWMRRQPTEKRGEFARKYERR